MNAKETYKAASGYYRSFIHCGSDCTNQNMIRQATIAKYGAYGRCAVVSVDNRITEVTKLERWWLDGQIHRITIDIIR